MFSESRQELLTQYYNKSPCETLKVLRIPSEVSVHLYSYYALEIN